MPRASGLAAEIQEAMRLGSELIPGGEGVFDVVVDRKKIFSKDQEGRFPDPGEILKLLEALV